MGREIYRQMVLRYAKERRRNALAVPGIHNFVIVLDGLKPGHNVAKTFRSAEAFGARAVHLVDIGPFDPSPAKGSFRKVPALFHDTFAGCRSSLQADGYTLFLLAPGGDGSLCRAPLPDRSAFVFGNEEWGFSFDPADYPDIRTLSIPQYGQVQSLNVSVAASIVMYEYVRQRQGKA